MDISANSLLFTPTNSSLIIINTDDFGWNQDRDEGIFSLYQSNRISSATVLINGYNAKFSLKKAKMLKIPLGLHINLTEGLPIRVDIQENSLLRKGIWQKNPDELEKEELIFHGKFEFFDMIKQGKIKKEHIFKEIQAQVKKTL